MIDLTDFYIGSFAACLGALAYIFFWRINKFYEALRHMILAVIAGIVYTSVRTNYGFPDFVVTVVVGWWAPDFISGLAERLKPWIKRGG